MKRQEERLSEEARRKEMYDPPLHPSLISLSRLLASTRGWAPSVTTDEI